MPPESVSSPALHRYAALFNARDWDGVRAMLADDVRLEVIARMSRRGRENVGTYFGNYEAIASWRAAVEIADGREVLVIHRGDTPHPVAVTFENDTVIEIRDYFHVPYIAGALAASLRHASPLRPASIQ